MSSAGAFWKKYGRVFDGAYAIPLDQVEEQYVERFRGPSRRIAVEIQSSDLPKKFLMCGARGSGKSTELVHIASLLRETHVPVRIDMAPLLSAQFGTLGLIATLAAAVEHTLRLWADPRPEIAFSARKPSAVFGALKSALEALGVVSTQVESMVLNAGVLLTTVAGPSSPGPALVATGAVLKATSAMLTSALAAIKAVTEGQLAGRVAIEGTPAAMAVVDALNLGLGELLREADGLPVLLVEGFDKARELAWVEGPFERLDLIDAVAAPTVFSGPVAMLYTAQLGGRGLHPLESRILPNIPVLQAPRDGDTAANVDEAGVAQLRKIFHLRAVHFGLPPGSVAEDALGVAVAMSSGLPREMFNLLEQARIEAIGAGRVQIVLADVEEAVKLRRQELQYYAASKEVFEVLWEVLRTRQRPSSNVGMELLYNGYVAAYPNGDTWFRPHEILAQWILRERAG